MEQDPSRRRHPPPRSGSTVLDLAAASPRRGSSPTSTPLAAARAGVSAFLGSRSVAYGYGYQMPSSPLAAGGAWAGAAARHATSQSRAMGSSRPTNFPIPPLPRDSMLGGGAAGSSSGSWTSPDSVRLPRRDAYADPAKLVSYSSSPPKLSFLGQSWQSPPAPPAAPQSETTSGLQYELPPLPASLPPVKMEEDEDSEAPASISSGDVVVLDGADDDPEEIDIVSHYFDLEGMCGEQNSDGDVVNIKQEITDAPTTGGLPYGALTDGADSSSGKAAMTGTCCSTSKVPTFTGIETKTKLALLSKWSAAGDGAAGSSMCRGRSVTSMHGGRLVMGFADGTFTGDEINKIMAEERLKELVVSNPKRVKKILRNRLTAKLSKERKIQHVVDLERRVKVLEKEADTLSAQLESLQKKSDELTSENNELKIKLQGMEQQTKLTNDLNQAITAEVNHLKWAANEINGHYYIQEEHMQRKNHSSQSQQAQEPQWNYGNNVMHNILR